MLPPIAPAICASSVRSRPLGGQTASGDLPIDPGIRVAGHRHLPEPPRCQRARGLAVRHDRLLLAPRTNDVGNCKHARPVTWLRVDAPRAGLGADVLPALSSLRTV